MAINKVVYGGDTLIDLTGDTVTEADVMQGVTFHSADGVPRVGTASGGGGVATAWELIATTTGTTSKSVDISNYDELLLVHKGQVSAYAIKYDTTVINVDDMGSDTIDITMGGISTSSGGYGCNVKLSKTLFAPQWVYQGGASVTAYTQTWKLYGRKTASEVIINGEY